MKTEDAEIIALQALGWIIADDDLSSVFLGATGASVDDLRARAAETEFQTAVLEFLMLDDDWVTGFCSAHGHPFDTPARALQALPGQALPNWT